MNIEQVSGIIDSLSNHYHTNKKNNFQKMSKAVLNRKANALSISANAANISEIYEQLRKSGNEDALRAFRDTMIRFPQEGSTEDFVHFVHTMQDIASTGPNLLEKVFSTLSDIEKISMKRDLSLDAVAWLSNIGYLSDDDIGHYLDATQHIMDYDNDALNETFNRFVKTTGQTVKKDNEEHTAHEYFKGIQEQTDSTEFKEFDLKFRKNEDESNK